MNIIIVGRKCTPKEAFKERAEKKLAKVERFFGEDTEAKVTVTVEKSVQRVEITVKHNGMVFRAEEVSNDMIEALDRCVDSLIRKIRKNKTKIEKKLRSGAFDYYTQEAPIPEESEYEILRIKKVGLKPTSPDEAILQMNLVGHQFYMFLNDDTNEINVVYRRKDGGYGILEYEIE